MDIYRIIPILFIVSAIFYVSFVARKGGKTNKLNCVVWSYGGEPTKKIETGLNQFCFHLDKAGKKLNDSTKRTN